jgi:hypothetical protein
MSEVFTPTPAWQEQVFKVLKEGGIQQVSYVPDAGHAHVIRRVNEDPAMRAIVLTTEEEGVAVAGGAWLGGQRHAVLVAELSLSVLDFGNHAWRVRRVQPLASAHEQSDAGFDGADGHQGLSRRARR